MLFIVKNLNSPLGCIAVFNGKLPGFQQAAVVIDQGSLNGLTIHYKGWNQLRIALCLKVLLQVFQPDSGLILGTEEFGMFK